MKPCYTNVTQLHLASLKPVWSELEASLKPVGCKFNFGVYEPLHRGEGRSDSQYQVHYVKEVDHWR